MNKKTTRKLMSLLTVGTVFTGVVFVADACCAATDGVGEMKAQTVQVTKQPKDVPIGIIEEGEEGRPYYVKRFKELNRWLGEKEGELLSIHVGYSTLDPLQGVVLVFDSNTGGISGLFFPTPTMTGPVRIISETNGMLTLESQEGVFVSVNDDRDPPMKEVSTPGHTTYFFDTKTYTYK